MALSEYEKQVLAQMEEEFRQGDPDLVSQMTADAPAQADPVKRRVTPARIASGLTLVVVGLVALVGAVSLGYSWWSILGGIVAFGLMVAGVLMAFTPSARSRAPRASRAPRRGRGMNAWQGFIQDQEQRWDDRRGSD